MASPAWPRWFAPAISRFPGEARPGSAHHGERLSVRAEELYALPVDGATQKRGGHAPPAVAQARVGQDQGRGVQVSRHGSQLCRSGVCPRGSPPRGRARARVAPWLPLRRLVGSVPLRPVAAGVRGMRPGCGFLRLPRARGRRGLPVGTPRRGRESGILLREWKKAQKGERTQDCRKGCVGCGMRRYEGACQ